MTSASIRNIEEDIKGLFSSDDSWQYRRSGFAVLHWSSNRSRRQTIEFTIAELDQLHPQLVASLRAQQTWMTMEGNGFSIPGNLVKPTLDLLRGNVLHVTDQAGVSFTCNNIIEIEETSTHLAVAGDMFDYKEEKNTRFATVTYVSVVKTNTDAFENRFPNWKKRWELCADLGLPKEEILAHVFNSSLTLNTTELIIPEMN